MISLDRSKYFLPTKQFRKLSILLAVHHENDLRQQQIAKRVGMSGAMVNGYIKQLKNEGELDVRRKNNRDLEYRLTDKGKSVVMGYLLDYSSEIVQLHSRAKEELIQRLRQVFVNGEYARVALYGGSETARLVLSAFDEFPSINITAIVDNDNRKWGGRISGHIIQNPDVLDKMDSDWIVIASFARQAEIESLLKSKGKMSSRILRLSSL